MHYVDSYALNKHTHCVCVSHFRYRDRIVIEPHPEPKKYENYELTGKIFCKRCHWNWGVMGVYKKVPFPIINIERFVVVTPNEMREKYRRWKEVPFHVEPISPDDLGKMRPAGENDDDRVDDDRVNDDRDDDDEQSAFWRENS